MHTEFAKIPLSIYEHLLQTLKWNDPRWLSDLQVRERTALIIFTQPLRSGRIWHKVNFLSGV